MLLDPRKMEPRVVVRPPVQFGPFQGGGGVLWGLDRVGDRLTFYLQPNEQRTSHHSTQGHTYLCRCGVAGTYAMDTYLSHWRVDRPALTQALARPPPPPPPSPPPPQPPATGPRKHNHHHRNFQQMAPQQLTVLGAAVEKG